MTIILSTRQIQVLQFIASGLTYDQIALRLCIRSRTVRYHVSKARHHLGVTSTPAAVAMAISLELIVPPVTFDKMTKQAF